MRGGISTSRRAVRSSRPHGRSIRGRAGPSRRALAAVLASLLVVLAAPPWAAVADDVTATHVATTLLSQLDPPSPDPAGITYLPDRDRLLVSDSEVNEVELFEGVNLFELRRSGELTATGDTLPWSDEPTGLSYDPATGRLYVSDDRGAGSFHVVDPGADGQLGTADDLSQRVRFASFDLSVDAEGIAFDPDSGHVFVADGGAARTVWRVSPGANGVFEGGGQAGDDTISDIDLDELGIADAEGIAINPFAGTLLVVDRRGDVVVELTRSGALVRTIDIGAVGPRSPSGITSAPSTTGEGWSLFIVDRGVDNSSDPDENDGKLYEFSLDLGPRVIDTAPACADAPVGRFDDVAETHARSIDCISWWGVTQGYPDGTYRDGRSIRRDQMATFVAAVLELSGGQLPADPGDAFADDDGNVHEAAIDQLAALGVVSGVDGERYAPERSVTRGQMATFLAATWQARVGEQLPAGDDAFADDDGSTHEDSIDRVAAAGFTGGTATGRYEAQQEVTRGQMATFLARLLAKLVADGHAEPPPPDEDAGSS